MSSGSGRPRRGASLRRLGVLLLILFALGALVLEQSQLLHLHKDESPALYNEQHLLAALLATPSSGVPLPDATGIAFLAVLAGFVVLLDGPPPRVSVLRHAAPRAPPAR